MGSAPARTTLAHCVIADRYSPLLPRTRSRLLHLSSVRDWTVVTVYCRAPWNATWIDFSGYRISLRVLYCMQAPWTASATDLRRQLHWLPIRQRIAFKLAAVAYKTRQSGIPEYLHCDIRDYQPCSKPNHLLSLLLSHTAPMLQQMIDN